MTGDAGWNVIAGNSVTGLLSCCGNDPDPVDNGSPNTVIGVKLGECSSI